MVAVKQGMTVAEFDAFCAAQLPFLAIYNMVTEVMGDRKARVRLPADPRHIRPGGTICGPAQMALADFSLYAAILGSIGEVPLAVTTNLSTNFLRRPSPGDLLAEARLIKLGRRLAVGEVFIHSDGETEPVAHVTGTYSIPPQDLASA
ncbi:MAG TPA: PaaI family thioesterase [Kiloniellaceae bacterium]|nr:PaaI family thioesterase [Kiloniellaceae bacterium]